jgi:hypothetical protein
VHFIRTEVKVQMYSRRVMAELLQLLVGLLVVAEVLDVAAYGFKGRPSCFSCASGPMPNALS